MRDELLISEGLVKRAVDASTVFRFVKLLSTPFNQWPAYKTGVIDEEGNTIKRKADRKTEEEKSSFTMFHRLVRNIKRLISKVPFGNSVLANFAAALFLIREYQENPRGEKLQERFEGFWNDNKEFINESYHVYQNQLLSEEVAMSTGAVQVYDKPIANDDEEHFMGSRVFPVDTDRFMKSRYGKKKFTRYERYVGSDDIGLKIRDYGRSYPKRGIILKDSKNGTMLWLRKPNT